MIATGTSVGVGFGMVADFGFRAAGLTGTESLIGTRSWGSLRRTVWSGVSTDSAGSCNGSPAVRSVPPGSVLVVELAKR